MIVTGNLKDFSLSDIIKMSCGDIQTCKLIIKTSCGEGIIYFSHGMPFHAELGHELGEDAVYYLLDETEKNGGVFRVEPNVVLPKRTISITWDIFIKNWEEKQAQTQQEVSSPNQKEETEMLIGQRDAITKILKNFKENNKLRDSETLTSPPEPNEEEPPRPMGRGESLVLILNNLKAREKDIEGAAIVSTEGFIIASALPEELEEDHVAAISAVILSMGERITNELARGTLEQVYVQGKKGYVFLAQAGPDALLTIITNPYVKLGMIFLDAKRAIAELKDFL